jgi:hypothetical protein
MKKRALNSKRSKKNREDSCPEEVKETSVIVSEVEIGEVICNYIRMLVSLIEGRKVGKDEILEMLRKKMRQHSMVNKRKHRYNFKYP